MKFLIVLAVAVACAAADVSHILSAEAQDPIVSSNYDIDPVGNAFRYGYETGKGIVASAQGVVKNPNSEDAALEVTGSYRYFSPDGTPVEMTYTANEFGFVASGSHIPVGPPIPEAIARSLEYIASRPVEAYKQSV